MNSRHRQNYVRALLGSAALSFVACAAHAQVQGQGTASTTGNSEAVGAIQEVVVTAEKRESTIQRTPVAVAAVTNDTLTREGVTQLANLEKVVPDVRLTRQGGAGAMTVAVRGVFSIDTSPTSESAVATHVDGGYLAKAQGIQGFLFDLERIEVAKGPQGTLYGRNANGGTINIITNKPVIGQTSAGGEFEYGTHDTLRTFGYFNAPLSDTVAVRFAFQTYSHNGYLKSGLDDANEQGARLGLRWRPSDRDNFWIVGDFSRIANKGDGVANVIAAQPGTAFYVPADPRDDRFYNTDTPSGLSEVYHRDQKNRGITAQYDHTMDFATWTTEVAYRKYEGQNVNQANLGQGALITIPGVGAFPQSARNYNPQSFESVSVESRLTSATSKPLAWVAGVYGFQDIDTGTMIGYGSLRSTTPSIQIANPYEKSRSGAVFGQATFTPTGFDALHIVAGARASRDEKRAEGIFTQFGTTVPYAVGPNSYSRSWSAVTYKAGVSYDLTDRNLIYGNYSTGFRSGGFGYGPGLNATDGPVYDPETIKAWEVGSKNRFFDNRLQLNFEGFIYHYRNFETGVTLRGSGSPLPVLTVGSAGAAIYRGLAADLEFAASPVDRIKADFSMIHAKYTDYVVTPPPGFVALGSTNLSNTRIPNVPQWTGNASYSHTFEMANGSLNAEVFGTVRGPVDFSAPVLDGPYGVVKLRGKTEATLNLSLRYDPHDGPWSFTVYGRNITDNLIAAGEGYSTTTHLTTAFFNDPRVIGFIMAIKTP